MSYLSSSLRLHFTGQFQATVSTVNNDVTHFNNETFSSKYHDRMTPGGSKMNGWWNPDGDGVWRLLGCSITSAFNSDSSAVEICDPISTYSIADSDNSAPAKIVDLDPQQQMVSTIFGLTVRIADTKGNTLMSGNYDPAAFTELWNKVESVAASGDMSMGAMWQSVISDIEWGDISASAFLQALKASADANNNTLSMKFNVDLYSMDWPDEKGHGQDNNFCRGRIVGTIGTNSINEPKHFVTGRQLSPTTASQGTTNFCAAIVDTVAKVIRLDLGNALRVNGSGDFLSVGDIQLQVTDLANSSTTTTIGILEESTYSTAGWYASTAGIVEISYEEALSLILESNPLSLVFSSSPNSIAATEPADGLYVRADLFVFRLGFGDGANVNFYATEFGAPAAGADIEFFSNHSQLQGLPAPAGTTPGTLTPKAYPNLGIAKGSPYVSAPTSGLSYPNSVTTDNNGTASISITGGDTQSFRDYIDGQLYGIGYTFNPQAPNPNDGKPNQWNFVSVLVFDKFQADSPPTWWGSMETIFQQYANLYPVMARFVNLGDFEQVKSYAGMLIHAFSLPESDPNAMPVTRDLSPAKRAAILTWLHNPLEGTQPSTPPPSNSESAATEQNSSIENTFKGGKSAAMARRACNL